MKYLMTGGTGFIGSHLVDRLLDNKHSVTAIGNLFCGKLENLSNHSLLDFKNLDIIDSDQINRVSSRGYDAVFHLAASADIGNDWENANLRATLCKQMVLIFHGYPKRRYLLQA